MSTTSEEQADSAGRVRDPATDQKNSASGSAFSKLSEDVGNDCDVIDQFVADYLGLLDSRLSGLRVLLAADESPEVIRVSVLSLETTSAMLGAADVVAAARALRQAVGSQRRFDAELLWDRLREAAEAFRQTLVGQGFTSSPPPHPADR